MTNSINLTSKDNPRWIIGIQPETAAGPAAKRAGPLAAIGAFLRAGTAAAAGWLAGVPRRAGASLFAVNDAEAHWRGWEITGLHGGLARRYRDRRFGDRRLGDGRLGDGLAGGGPAGDAQAGGGPPGDRQAHERPMGAERGER